MGFAPSLVVTEQRVIDAIEHIRMATKRKKKFVAIHCSDGAVVSEMLHQGFDLASLSTDIRIFVAALQQELQAARTAQKKDSIDAPGAY